MKQHNPWLPLHTPSGANVTRLFCFPHAGGSAQAYRLWQKTLGEGFEVCAVQPPGRWGHNREASFTDMKALVRAAIDALGGHLTEDFALFGHSVGGAVAFEFARELRRAGLPQPRHLFVAGRRAPHIDLPGPGYDDLTDAELVELISEQYGAIHEAIRNDPDLLSLTLPTLRADLKLDFDYRCTDEPPLNFPITVFGGSEDKTTTRPWLEGWRRYTLSAFTLELFPGSHFFVNDARPSVLNAVVRHLNAPDANSS